MENLGLQQLRRQNAPPGSRLTSWLSTISLRSAPAFLCRKMKVKKSGLDLMELSCCCQLTLSNIREWLSTLGPVRRKPFINSWKISVPVCHVHNLNLTFFIFCNPSILPALLLNTCLGI